MLEVEAETFETRSVLAAGRLGPICSALEHQADSIEYRKWQREYTHR